MLPSPQPPWLRLAKRSKEWSGEGRTNEQTEQNTSRKKYISYVNIQDRGAVRPGICHVTVFKMTTMKKMNNTTAVVSAANNHITALVHMADAGRPARSAWSLRLCCKPDSHVLRAALASSWSSLVVRDPTLVGREGEETTGGGSFFFFFQFSPPASAERCLG